MSVHSNRRAAGAAAFLAALAVGAGALGVSQAVDGPARPAGSPAGNPVAASTGPVPASVTPAPEDDYDRTRDFGGWQSAGPGCDTRDVILKRDLRTVTVKGCDVTDGVGISQYTGEEIREADSDVDHVFPLKAAKADGAGTWTPEQRREFANNPENLLAVDASSNRSKGDKLPSRWMPRFRPCEYGQRLMRVAEHPVPSDPTRSLPLAQADLDAIERACTR